MKQYAKWERNWHASSLGFVLAILILMCPTVSAAQGQLETPQPGSFQSGIGMVRGWVCQATRVDIEVVGRGILPAAYGDPRADTQSQCGDVNNGFSVQVNWNELGEGNHTVRALVDGIELGRALIIVATLGVPYLRGAQGDFVIEPFPQSGKQTRLRWEESRQLIVLSNSAPASMGGSSARNDAKLEDPQPGTFQSGIGLVRGWVCAAGHIDIEIDGRFSLPAIYGEQRGDTQAVCDDSNNGFSILVNWNDLGDGTHTVRALADGVELGSATFTVVTLGMGSFPRGLVGDFVLNNFPQSSFQTEVRWQESQQNFVIAGARFPGQNPALCKSHTASVSDHDGDNATITWANPCLLAGNVLLLRVQVPSTASRSAEEGDRETRGAADGTFSLCKTDLRIEQLPSFGSTEFRLLDLAGKDVCHNIPRGNTLEAILQANSQSSLNFNNPFAVTYRGFLAADFFTAPAEGKPTLATSVTELSFEDSSLSARQEKSFTVTNTGGGVLQGGMIVVASDSGGNEFSLAPATINVGAGQSQTVTVRFSPLSSALVTASLRITSTGGARTILLRGQVQSEQARLTVSSTSLEFGGIEVPGTVDRTFTITNSGAGVLTGRVETGRSGSFRVTAGETFSLNATQSQVVTIRFVPSKRGTYTESATIRSNDGVTSVTLTATATGPELLITGLKLLYPDSPPPFNDIRGLDFGNCKSGTESFTVHNVGESTLIGTVTTSAPFRVTKGAIFSLVAGARQKVSVKLTKKLKSGQSMLGFTLIQSNGGSDSVPMFAGCIKIKFD